MKNFELLTVIYFIIKELPFEYGFLLDQLKRASLSLSLTLNIAEGNAKFSKNEKLDF